MIMRIKVNEKISSNEDMIKLFKKNLNILLRDVERYTAKSGVETKISVEVENGL
jgi:hypothetical protein